MSRPRNSPRSNSLGMVDGRAHLPPAEQVVDALRVWAADNTDVTHHLARWLGVGTADAEAFGQLVHSQSRGAPLTPTLLGRRIGLSTGATTALLNRLEAAGLVVRSREHQDRRVVTLRVPPHVNEQAVRFFTPLSERVEVMMQQHSPELLRQIVTVLDDLHDAIAEVVADFEVSAPAGGVSRSRRTHDGEGAE